MASDKRYLWATYILHPFISLFTPCLLLLGFDASLRQWIPWPDLTTIPQYLLLPLAGVSKLLLLHIFTRERLKGIARLQEFIYTSIFLYLLSCLMRWQGIPASFIPRLENTYIFFLALLQWLLTFLIARNLEARSAMLSFLAENKNYPAQAKALFESLLLESYSGLKRLNNILAGLLVLSLTMLFLVWLLGLPGRIYIAQWLIPSFLALLISRLLVNLFLREEYLYSTGFKPVPLPGQRLGFWLVVLLAISCSFAFILSANNSLFDLRSLPLPPLNLQEEEIQLDDRPLPDLSQEDLPITPFAQRLAGFLQGLLLVLGLIALSFIAAFLLSPFFSQGFWRYLIQSRPFKVLVEFLKKLIVLLAEACKALRQLWAIFFSSKGSVSVAKVLREFSRPWGLGRKKKAILTKTHHQAKVVRLFYRLLKWARQRGFSYVAGQTATDFVLRLASHYPQKKVELYFILAVFTEALFAGRPLAPFKIRQYQEALKRILKEKGPVI